MKNLFSAFILIFSLLSATAFSQPQYIFPATEADVPKLIETIQLMSFLEETYRPFLAQKNLAFKWNFDWNQNYLGAGSNLYNNEFSILLYGGFIRTPYSGFHLTALTLCHEFGHLLGGAPFQRLTNSGTDDWSSAEGQSDWFAGTQCLPLVYEKFKEKIRSLPLASQAQIFCAESEKIGLCEFIVTAGLKFSELNFTYFNTNLSALETQAPEILSSAPEKPSETLHSKYPTMQCRLDTYKKATQCLSQNQSKCQRPRCWFKP